MDKLGTNWTWKRGIVGSPRGGSDEESLAGQPARPSTSINWQPLTTKQWHSHRNHADLRILECDRCLSLKEAFPGELSTYIICVLLGGSVGAGGC
jgi:hypothetical protein